MSGGCGGVTCAARTDFAALVNVVDYCVGLYDAAKDTRGEWQPVGGNADDFVTNILQPARTARNTFAHNSRLAFDSEEVVHDRIDALLALLARLPVPVSDTGGAKRTAAKITLKHMRGLAATAGSDGVVHDDMRDEEVALDGSGVAAELDGVMRFMIEAGSRDAEELSGLLPEYVVEEGSAEVPRRVAVRRGSGGAGRGDGVAALQEQLAVVTLAVARAKAWEAVQRVAEE